MSDSEWLDVQPIAFRRVLNRTAIKMAASEQRSVYSALVELIQACRNLEKGPANV
jgi:hypothetical protein